MNAWGGIDVGSSATKAVILDDCLAIIGKGLCRSGADFRQAAAEAFEQALQQAGLKANQVSTVVATGYGRSNVDLGGIQRTEIDCHARGAFHAFPQAITVVDIGGQDNKIIELDQTGRRLRFNMNRKCAAGTGAFLEEIALRLNLPLDRFSALAQNSQDPKVSIGSYCTVFAMTEILSKIRQGVKIEDLARAALDSVARRVLETQAISGLVVATGGVIEHQPLLPAILAQMLSTEVKTPAFPQFTGALGAALFAGHANHGALTSSAPMSQPKP